MIDGRRGDARVTQGEPELVLELAGAGLDDDDALHAREDLREGVDREGPDRDGPEEPGLHALRARGLDGTLGHAGGSVAGDDEHFGVAAAVALDALLAG